MSGYTVKRTGGTAIGEKIRELILDPRNKEMTGITEALLYAASRAQHVEQVIKPALEQGKVVICDRFIDSSIAYQGYGRGLGQSVASVNEYAIDGCMPDMTFFLKVKPDVGTDRIENREKDRIELEQKDFHYDVYKGYEALEKACSERIKGIDASRSIEEVFKEISKCVDMLLQK